MSVAPKSPTSARRRQAQTNQDKAVGNLGIVTSEAISDLHKLGYSLNGQSIPMRNVRSSPSWLLRLYALQRPSCAILFLLLAAMLTIYSWSVYSQKMWNEVYKSLKILQLHERQLTTTSEILKNQMALQAEQDATALVPVTPSATIFLQPAQGNPAPAADAAIATKKETNQTLQINPGPLSY